MAAALHGGVGSVVCCVSQTYKSLLIDNGSVSILSKASLQSNSRFGRVCNGQQPQSVKSSELFTPLRTPVSRRWSNLRPSNSSIRAEASGQNEGELHTSLAPLVPETPTGQYLVSVLRNRPHMFDATAAQQLERLAADRDAAALSGSGTDMTQLYTRIKEVKAEERRKAVEEIMYALIVQESIDAGVALFPKIRALSDNDARHVDISQAHEIELEAVHSPEALQMVRDHVEVVALRMLREDDPAVALSGRGTSSFLDQQTFAQIIKFRLGQIYAASVMYGYFLRRVDQRFQLEKHMKGLPGSRKVLDTKTVGAAMTNFADSEFGREKLSQGSTGLATDMKSKNLTSYVMSFDPETLRRCAIIRSKESLSVIDKHAEAVFGKPEIRVGPDDTIKVSFSGLRRLVLDAVAVGTFLWDVESRVDSQYSLILH